MRAITLKTFGEPEVLEFSDIPKPVPGTEEILVRVRAFGLNRADLLQRRGHYPPPPGESDVLGLEIAGEVCALGDGVSGFSLGDRVFGLVGSGAYAEYCVMDHKLAVKTPESWRTLSQRAFQRLLLRQTKLCLKSADCNPVNAY